ncbi:hypothetical protein FE782_16005 [Paenibacillus antri]|uniref:DUF559 domain-containing protein n=1 Tax=Paenibacillus antri TaxID=2582848 RepID=A0A5R9GDG9_9BACL|nr:hypothetical protein [Paenibacillus antri]TLS51234.1 hypothetical protein FE782_16005 [Paenibacillus antri]
MHPAVERYVEEQNRKAAARKVNPLNGLAIRFLEEVWGPVFDFRFEGLEAESPFKDFRGRQRFADFRYDDGNAKTAIELDGYTTHAKHISSEQFDDHVERQNDLLFNGWFLVRFSSGMIIEKPEVCRRQLIQTIGHWHYIRFGELAEEEERIWVERRKRIARIAIRQGGSIRPVDVAKVYRVSNQTAAVWLRQFADEGYFEPAGGSKRITSYRLRRFEE